VGPLDRLPAQAYGSDASERVYAEMFRVARQALASGRSVLLDASFLEPNKRGAAAALAAEANVAFQGVWLEGAASELRRRVGARTGDASDADLAALEDQLGRDLGHIEWRGFDAADLVAAADQVIAEIGPGI